MQFSVVLRLIDTVCNDLPITDLDNPRGIFRHLHIVGDQNNGMTRGIQLTQNPHHFHATMRV